MKYSVCATAGHIDHGKTTLVKRLTGVDTDRLPEEKQRSMTIELGFAPLFFEDPHVMGIVDVPGHERFLRTMIKGITGAQSVLLVVAADEGVKPQTIEHLRAISVLKPEKVICALTKSDLASSEIQAQRRSEISRIVQKYLDRPISVIPCNTRDGAGIEHVRSALSEALRGLSKESQSELFLPVDRVFSRPGFGTIVTGTLSSGTLRQSETLRVFPEDLSAQVRNIEIFGRRADSASPVCRVAVNLAGAKRDEIHRGSILFRDHELKPTHRIRARVQLFEKVSRKQLNRVRVFWGTCEHLGRAIFVSNDLSPDVIFEIRFRERVLCRDNEPIFLCTESPIRFFGGGRIVTTHVEEERTRPIPTKVKPPEIVPNDLGSFAPYSVVTSAGAAPPFIEELARDYHEDTRAIRKIFEGAAAQGNLVRVSSDFFAGANVAEEYRCLLQRHFSKNQDLSMRAWKEMCGLTRKHATPWLEYFDAQRWTIRRPDSTRISGPHLRENGLDTEG